jgi:hypothetical protein
MMAKKIKMKIKTLIFADFKFLSFRGAKRPCSPLQLDWQLPSSIFWIWTLTPTSQVFGGFLVNVVPLSWLDSPMSSGEGEGLKWKQR